MLKDLGKLLLCVLGFIALFMLILWPVTLYTNTSFIDSARSIHAIGILVAICVGGVFAYQRLQIFRTFEPHLTISHNICHRYIGDSYAHIDVTATLRNSSKVQVEIREGFALLQLVAPVSDENIEAMYAERLNDGSSQQLQWTTLDEIHREWTSGRLIVEPGESHPETYEFVILNNVESVIIYTYFYNPRFSSDSNNSAEGWVATTVYDIVDKR